MSFICRGIKNSHVAGPNQRPTRVVTEVRNVTTTHHAGPDPRDAFLPDEQKRWKHVTIGEGTEVIREVLVCDKHIKRFARREPAVVVDTPKRVQYHATPSAKKPRGRDNDYRDW